MWWALVLIIGTAVLLTVSAALLIMQIRNFWKDR